VPAAKHAQNQPSNHYRYAFAWMTSRFSSIDSTRFATEHAQQRSERRATTGLIRPLPVLNSAKSIDSYRALLDQNHGPLASSFL
jgi:hypothetical protein